MRALGRFRVGVVSDGGFRLDGGAMFGVVPKALWSRVKPADERNRIAMGTNCLLIEAGDDLVLVDTGIGDKLDPKLAEIYGLEPGAERLPAAISRAGYELGDVTHVVLSHLHFDHCGWNTRRDGSGALVPTFSKARYWLNRGEVEHGRSGNERDRASYFPENWEPLLDAGVAELFEEEVEVLPGIRAIKTPGHNADMCVVTVDGGDGARLVFFADLVPTRAHVPFPWIMSYDLYPMETLANKKVWIPRAAEEAWLCVFEHDAECATGRIVEERPGRFAVVPTETAAG